MNTNLQDVTLPVWEVKTIRAKRDGIKSPERAAVRVFKWGHGVISLQLRQGFTVQSVTMDSDTAKQIAEALMVQIAMDGDAGEKIVAQLLAGAKAAA